MAQSRKTIESVWAAKGNLPDSAIVATSDGKYPALDGSLITGIAKPGDMSASVYDPTTIQADAFARANHTGTQAAYTISDFDTEVSNNTSVAANTAKVGITTTQAADIVTNNAKVGITPTQADDIVANNAKVGITPTQASDIVTNNAKVGITSAQASDINTALQPADPTLDLVTDNGATTTNNITVGSKFATGNNVASGTNCIAIGGTGNSAIGANCEVVGGGGSEASGTGSSVFGGSSHTNRGNWTATVGGLNHDVIDSAIRGAIIGGYDHHLNHSDSVIIGGNDITTDAVSTVFVPSLNVGAGFKMPTGAADSYILTSSVTGAGTWQANAKVGNDTTGEAAGSDSVLNMVSLTQAQYDTALANFPATIKETTLYIIKP